MKADRVPATPWVVPASELPNGEALLLGRQLASQDADIAGKSAAELEPGVNDVSRIPSGVYFVRMQSAGETVEKRVMLLQ